MTFYLKENVEINPPTHPFIHVRAVKSILASGTNEDPMLDSHPFAGVEGMNASS